MRRSALFTLWILTIAVPSYAAPQLPALLPVECDRLVELLLATTAPDDRRRVAEALVDMTSHTQCLADAMMQRATFPSFIKLLETLRTDKQSGASTGTGGSTNLVSKGTTAKILSVAAEYGALTQTVNKQIVTVQGSADAIPAVLIRHNLVRYCPTRGTPDCASSTLIQTLQRFSYAVSFDTSTSAETVSGTAVTSASGTAVPVTFSADNNSVTAVTARAVLVNARDKLSQSFQEAWRERVLKSPGALNEAARRLLQSAGGFLTLVIDDPGYGPWQTETVRLLLAAPRDQVQRVWDGRLQALVEVLRPRHPDLLDRAAEAVAAFRAFRFEEDAVVLTLQRPVATLQYDYKRPLNQPSTSTLRFVFDKGLADGWSFAANGAVELYNDRPSSFVPGRGLVRDAQVGLQFQKSLATVNLLGAAAIAATYYFQYQNRPAILELTPGISFPGISFVGLPGTATQVFATRGNIQVGQIRLVLGPENSSARFPVSITYSNRTEFVDRPGWRGQVGVSYDFDSLFGK
jgi:hypothetical protein